jgi:NAD+ kinase
MNHENTQCVVHSLLDEHKDKFQISYDKAQQSYEGLAQERQADKDPNGDAHNVNEQNSRLLTKKQISDMAFGIRELAKRLAHIRLKMNVRNVFILTKAHDENLIRNAREVTEWLMKYNKDYRVYVEDTLEKNKTFDAESLVASKESYKGRLKFWNNELCKKRPQTFDIILCVRWFV